MTDAPPAVVVRKRALAPAQDILKKDDQTELVKLSFSKTQAKPARKQDADLNANAKQVKRKKQSQPQQPQKKKSKRQLKKEHNKAIKAQKKEAKKEGKDVQQSIKRKGDVSLIKDPKRRKEAEQRIAACAKRKRQQEQVSEALKEVKRKKFKEFKDIESKKHSVHRWLHQEALKRDHLNIAKSYECPTVLSLDQLKHADKNADFKKAPPYQSPDKVFCYGCHELVAEMHPFYCFSCVECGNKFWDNRYLSRDLTDRVAVVTGCRTKLGHQITLKLLRAGCTVVGTTRQAERALSSFREYQEDWIDRLHICSLDLDVPDLESAMKEVVEKCQSLGRCDILINSAAQTIRVREKCIPPPSSDSSTQAPCVTNRYGDAKFVPTSQENSWNHLLPDLTQQEMEEVLRVNAIAPTLLVQSLLSLLLQSDAPFVIQVHAREGLFNVKKSKKHMHTNMAKAALHMATLSLRNHRYKTTSGRFLAVHGCDPGWISIDEYYDPDQITYPIPPIDEVDGAARILFPLWKDYLGHPQTRRHYNQFIN